MNCDSNENDHQDELLKQLNRPIYESEIREQTDKAKPGKSPGADGILNELIKLAKEKLTPILKMLFNIIFHYSIFPSSWRLGIITSIFKGLAKLANIACQTLLFVSVSLAMDNQRTLLFGREQ